MSELPERVETARLRLILATPADAADMLAGRRQDRWHPDYPRQDDVDAASMIGAGGSTWGVRHIVLEQQAVGSIGFFGPPQDGEVEIGFGVVAAVRRRGIVSEAVRGAARRDRPAGRRRPGLGAARQHPEPAPLASAGFTQLRGSNDEGCLVMARPLPVG